MATSSNKRAWWAFAPLLALFLLLRLLQAASATGSFDLEEGFTIAAAWELLHGGPWPYQAYQLSAFEGGSLVVVLLTLPFCWLLGPSVFALKLTAITLSAVALVGLFLLCRELWGLRAALFCCLLYICFPSPVYAYSMTAHGFHPDSLVFQLLFLWGVARCYNRPPGRWGFVWTGALGGFAVYFAYISVITVVAALLPWLWLRLRRREQTPRPGLLPLAGGLVAGALPMIAYNLANGFAGLRTYHGSVLSYLYNPGAGAEAARSTRSHTLECLLRFSDMGGYGRAPYPIYPFHALFDTLFLVLAGVVLAWPLLRLLFARLCRGSVSPPIAPAVLLFDRVFVFFCVLSLGIFFASGHPVERWHLVPMLVLLLVALAGRLDAAWRAGKLGKAVAVLLLAALCGYGLWFNLQDIRPRWMGFSLKLDGRRYLEFLSRVGVVYFARRQEHREPALAALELGLPLESTLLDMENDRDTGRGLLEKVWDAPKPLAALRAFLKQGPPPGSQLDRHRAAGFVLSRLYLEQKLSAEQLARFVISVGGRRAAGNIMETVGAAVGQKLLEQPAKIKALQQGGMRRVWLHRFAHGLGRTTDLSTVLHGEELLCSHQRLPAWLTATYVRGVGHGIARRLIRAVPKSVDTRICPRMRPHFLAGVKQFGTPRTHALPRMSL